MDIKEYERHESAIGHTCFRTTRAPQQYWQKQRWIIAITLFSHNKGTSTIFAKTTMDRYQYIVGPMSLAMVSYHWKPLKNHMVMRSDISVLLSGSNLS